MLLLLKSWNSSELLGVCYHDPLVPSLGITELIHIKQVEPCLPHTSLQTMLVPCRFYLSFKQQPADVTLSFMTTILRWGNWASRRPGIFPTEIRKWRKQNFHSGLPGSKAYINSSQYIVLLSFSSRPSYTDTFSGLGLYACGRHTG